MTELTKRQQSVWNFIQETSQTQGAPPTVREIAAHFGFQSPNAALIHLKALRNKGYLKSIPGRARMIHAVDPNQPDRPRPRVQSVPIYGTIPAGFPTENAQEEDGCLLMDVETLGVKPNARTFAVKVRGDSMIGKHIMSGDIAIIEHGVHPRPGDVVAALIDGQVTLKTFLYHRNKPYLRAENPKYPNLLPQDELQVQGVMVALVRKRK